MCGGNLTRRFSDKTMDRGGGALKQAYHLRLARVAVQFCTTTRVQQGGQYWIDPVTLLGLRHAADESYDRLTSRETPVDRDSQDVRHLRLAKLSLQVCDSARRESDRIYTLTPATFSALCRAADESMELIMEARP